MTVKQTNFTRTQVRIPPDLHVMIKRFADERQMSMNEAFVLCCREGLRRQYQPLLNRRPFLITEIGITENGRVCYDASVAKKLFDALGEKAEDTMNDCFENFFKKVRESAVGNFDERSYIALIEGFIGVFVASCEATLAELPPF